MSPCQIPHIVYQRGTKSTFFASLQGDTLPASPGWPSRETGEPDPIRGPAKKCHVAASPPSPTHTHGQCNIYTRTMTIRLFSPWVPRYRSIIHSSRFRAVRWSIRLPPHIRRLHISVTSFPRGLGLLRVLRRCSFQKLKINFARTEAANQRRTLSVIRRPDHIRFARRRPQPRPCLLRVCS